MYQPNNKDNHSRIVGIVCTALYALCFVALMLWGGINIEVEKQQLGMLVDFGTTLDSGSGEEDTALADDYSLPEPTATPKNEPIQTQPEEESPAVEEANIATDTEATHEEQKEVEETPPAVEPKPREVNTRALFPGNKPSSESPSEGVTDDAKGNQGQLGGSESDIYDTSGGEGGFQPDWNLEGRRPRNEFPRPRYVGEDHGIVVVEIWVDGDGDVVGTAFQAKGSTVSPSSPLVAEALEAARGVKFDKSEQDIQVGTITYSFRLNTGARK